MENRVKRLFDKGIVNLFMISINHFVAHSFLSGSDLDSTAIGLHKTLQPRGASLHSNRYIIA